MEEQIHISHVVSELGTQIQEADGDEHTKSIRRFRGVDYTPGRQSEHTLFLVEVRIC